MKAWELARLILPSISSRAPDKTHLPAPQQDHVNLFMLRWTPRVFRWGFSASVEFTYLRKTPCKSRVGSSRRWRESDVFPRIVSDLTCDPSCARVRPSLLMRFAE